jgi:hypothetical protein
MEFSKNDYNFLRLSLCFPSPDRIPFSNYTGVWHALGASGNGWASSGPIPAQYAGWESYLRIDMTVETALLVPIPKVEPFVSSFRNKYDPSAVKGVPAHVTVLYPFKPPSEITPEVVQTLSELFGAEMLFDVTFSRTGRFPEVLYFSPEPVETFQNLTQKVADQFPDTPPYGGQFAEVIPHLTIAHVSDEKQLQEIEIAFDHIIKDHLPIRAQAKEVLLMDNESSTWQVRHRFRLKVRNRSQTGDHQGVKFL